MQISTSYYGKINEIKKEYPNAALVSISRYIPDYVEVDIHELDLAPDENFLIEYKNSTSTEKEKIFTEHFKDKLNTIDIMEVVKKFNSDFIILLCYESNNIKKSTFCHRRIVAEVLQNELNQEIQELFFDYDNYEIENYKVKLKNELNEW